MSDQKFYGVYAGKCVDVSDPQKRSRIRLKVRQVLGDAITNWAEPCLPVTSNANHPDHKPHTPAQIVARIADHDETLTTGAGGIDSHSHSVVINLSHDPTGSSLTHAHVTYTDPQDEGGSQEHTLHRKVPRLNQTVWVMFIGGDPNFPIWIGVSP